ncbi:MAG: FkbM family methyltransferase, partial [Thermodesulfovibrionales bacterium]
MKQVDIPGGSFFCREGEGLVDEHVLGEVLRGDYSHWLTLGRGFTVLDIGANAGAFTVQAALAGSRVYSCEPHPENAKVLRENVKLNGLGGVVEVIEAAVVGDAYAGNEIPLSMRVSAFASGNCTVLPVGDVLETLLVPTIKISQLLRISNPSQVKIDCEGGEYQIIESICSWPRVKAIAMEVHLPAMGLGQEGD